MSGIHNNNKSIYTEYSEGEKGMGEMEQIVEKEKAEGHKQIAAALKDLGSLGYWVNNIHWQSGFLTIGCYCPQVNEGSTLSMDGISESFKE